MGCRRGCRSRIDDIVIITSPHKKAVEDHFDRMAELEAALESKGKREMLGVVRHITDLATFHFTRQGAPSASVMPSARPPAMWR